MVRLSFFGGIVLAVMMSCNAQAQDFPSKPLRIVTGSAGGGVDFTARLMAQGLSANLGQQVIVDNRTSGVVQGQVVARAVPDGYTLLVAGGTFLTFPLFQEAPYDPIRDFTPITAIETAPNVLAVHPTVPVKSVGELISYAKSRPGELNYAAVSVGGLSHLAMELFKSMTGTNVVYVAYKGSGAAMTGVLGAEVQLVILDPGLVIPQAKAGKLRALAVTSAQPSVLAPGLPTIASSGVPGYEAASVSMLYAPVKTSAAIVVKLNEAAVRYLRTSEAKEAFLKGSLEVVPNTPAQAAALVKTTIERTRKLISDAGIKVN